MEFGLLNLRSGDVILSGPWACGVPHQVRTISLIMLNIICLFSCADFILMFRNKGG